MIYALTCNPSLDLNASVKNLIPNEKNYVDREIYTAGGNGINAAIIARRLKSQVRSFSFLGGSNGDRIAQLLNDEKLDHQFVQISGQTRMNVTVSNRHDHMQTRLSFPGPKISIANLNSMNRVLAVIKEHDILIIGGSLPTGINTNYISPLIQKMNDKGVRCIVDMPSTELKKLIRMRPFLIKPNLVEFQALVGKKLKTTRQVVEQAQHLLKWVDYVCVSSVEGGAILVSEGGSFFGKTPSLKLKSSVGAGDSMVGAMASYLDRSARIEVSKMLSLGLAASCATLTEPGLKLGSAHRIRSYLAKINVKPIQNFTRSNES